MTCSKLIEGLFTKFNKRARHEKLDKKEIKKTFIFVKIVLYIALITVHKLGVGVYSKKKKKLQPCWNGQVCFYQGGMCLMLLMHIFDLLEGSSYISIL